jgi:hypothetical protein
MLTSLAWWMPLGACFCPHVHFCTNVVGFCEAPCTHYLCNIINYYFVMFIYIIYLTLLLKLRLVPRSSLHPLFMRFRV